MKTAGSLICTKFRPVYIKTTSMKAALSYFLLAIATLTSCAQNSSTASHLTNTNNNNTTMDSTITPKGTEVATFANGCFWCTEAIFEELDGVISAVSGYSG